MNNAKSVSLFLMDGAPDGVIVCEISNWTGKGFKVPRCKLRDLSQRPDLKKPGVYILVGKDEEDADVLYIGEAEDVCRRILLHQDKDFWSEALAFVGKDENLNKTQVQYLEFILHKAAAEALRYRLFNYNAPACPAISEPGLSVLNEFAENLQLLVGAMGYRIFQKLTNSNVATHDKYMIRSTRGADATALLTSEGVVVLKDSQIATSEVPSTPLAVIRKRQDLFDAGIIKEFRFLKDYLFPNPSTAAALVMGRSANGLIEWKKEDGTTMKDNEPKPT